MKELLRVLLYSQSMEMDINVEKRMKDSGLKI